MFDDMMDAGYGDGQNGYDFGDDYDQDNGKPTRAEKKENEKQINEERIRFKPIEDLKNFKILEYKNAIKLEETLIEAERKKPGNWAYIETSKIYKYSQNVIEKCQSNINFIEKQNYGKYVKSGAPYPDIKLSNAKFLFIYTDHLS